MDIALSSQRTVVSAAAAAVNNETLHRTLLLRLKDIFSAGFETALNFDEFRRSLGLMPRAIADKLCKTPFTSDGRLNCERRSHMKTLRFGEYDPPSVLSMQDGGSRSPCSGIGVSASPAFRHQSIRDRDDCHGFHSLLPMKRERNTKRRHVVRNRQLTSGYL